jgi:holo-[acyl-carrier protein] synthase
MIKGIGIDIVSTKRIKDQIHNQTFVKRILSAEEYKVFEQFQLENRKVEYLAGRFAAKEAIFKAIRKGSGDINYRDISVLNDETNAPYVIFDYLKSYQVHITISHEDDYVVSFATIEKL